MRRDFCTYFDKNYLSRGLALFDSLARHCPSFRLFVLCLDEETFRFLSATDRPELVLIRLSHLEADDPELAATRPTRSMIEYYFTLTPAWLCHVFARFSDVELLTYIDSDFRMFSSPEPLYEELGVGSIAVVEHRLPGELDVQKDRGRFNVGWLSFRRDDNGLACVRWWRERCIEWCYDRVENGKFADQKYLDEWPQLFGGVRILQHPGVSIAPWNLAGHSVRIRAGHAEIDGRPLICFHFHGFKHLIGLLYETGLAGYPVALDRELRDAIFNPYLRELLAHERELARAQVTSGHARSMRYVKGGVADMKQLVLRVGSSLYRRSFLIAPVGR